MDEGSLVLVVPSPPVDPSAGAALVVAVSCVLCGEVVLVSCCSLVCGCAGGLVATAAADAAALKGPTVRCISARCRICGQHSMGHMQCQWVSVV